MCLAFPFTNETYDNSQLPRVGEYHSYHTCEVLPKQGGKHYKDLEIRGYDKSVM